MTERPLAPALVRETRVAGGVPRWEVPGWRERFDAVAGITGRGEVAGSGFNLGLSTREPVGAVMGRWRALRAAEPGFRSFVLGHQVHEATVARHGPNRGWTIVDGVDGHVTTSPGVMLLVTVADCIPVYLIAPEPRGIALLHAGWRGTAAGILERGVAALSEAAGVPRSNIEMHCGVGICGGCYEVGSEVMAAFGSVPGGTGPWQLDLRAALADQAARLGLREVTISGHCSAHDRGAFYSHRASGGADGRMVAYLGLPEPGAGVRGA